MRTKLTLLAVGLAATIAAAPAQAALDEGGGAAVTPVVSFVAEGSAASAKAHPTARSNAVIAWNANAGEAAIAACISPIDNPLHESRLYAMAHVAIHDALNAIDRRSRPYAFSAKVKHWASPEAAVAAAAHDVLVPLLNQIPAPFPAACGAAGAASVEADYTAALATIPDGRAKTRGIEVGEAAPRPSSPCAPRTARTRCSSSRTTHRARTPASTASHPAPRSCSHLAGRTSRRSCCETAPSSVQARPTR